MVLQMDVPLTAGSSGYRGPQPGACSKSEREFKSDREETSNIQQQTQNKQWKKRGGISLPPPQTLVVAYLDGVHVIQARAYPRRARRRRWCGGGEYGGRRVAQHLAPPLALATCSQRVYGVQHLVLWWWRRGLGRASPALTPRHGCSLSRCRACKATSPHHPNGGMYWCTTGLLFYVSTLLLVYVSTLARVLRLLRD
jgi:hypothetical protein